MSGGWTPHVVVACVVERDGRFLLVEERIEGELRMNQPAGHWEQGETLVQGAIRETLEESGWDVEPTHVLGIYHYDPADLEYGFLRIAFVAKALQERPGYKLDKGIERPVWLTRDEVAATVALHRSPMVLRCVDDHLTGQRFPLSMLNHLNER